MALSADSKKELLSWILLSSRPSQSGHSPPRHHPQSAYCRVFLEEQEWAWKELTGDHEEDQQLVGEHVFVSGFPQSEQAKTWQCSQGQEEHHVVGLGTPKL